VAGLLLLLLPLLVLLLLLLPPSADHSCKQASNQMSNQMYPAGKAGTASIATNRCWQHAHHTTAHPQRSSRTLHG